MTVTRPANGSSEHVHRFLRDLRALGFEGVPEPLAIDPDERERLTFIPGDVALPPYPAWARTDEALASIAALLGRYHQAAQNFDVSTGQRWNEDLADPEGGAVVCHNDVCLENIVFRDGQAVALLDFDFAAPGRPVYDVACMARLCVPLEPPDDSKALGFDDHDPFHRLRVLVDGYGLPVGAADLFTAIEKSMDRASEFVRGRVEAGDPGFVEMFNRRGGQPRFDRRRRWFADNRDQFRRALG